MSRRDIRFKPLHFKVNDTNSGYTAEALNYKYIIALCSAAFGVRAGYTVFGTEDKDAIYYNLDDAKMVCQLDFENKVKAYLQ